MDTSIIILTTLLFSTIVNCLLFVPFINLLYTLKFQRQLQKTRDVFERPTPIFDKLHKNKAGIPVGAGLLMIFTTTLLFPGMLLLMRYLFVPITEVYQLVLEVKILVTTFLSFGMLGLYDDLKKTFIWNRDSFFGLRLRHKLIIETVLSIIIAAWIYTDLGIEILHIPFIGVFDIGIWFIPFAAVVILAFSNAYNITDGLDGLAGGVLLIALITFLVISSSILDTPLSIFIALWLGALLAFLYFNVFPARIMLGDVGALSFGATFAVVGLILGKALALVIIGGIFVIEVASSLVQLLSKKFLHRKLMAVAPFHLWLQLKGWPEPKIVMRFWLFSIFLAIVGLWLARLTR